MSITPSQYGLLVFADILQDYFVDKTLGTPLAGGLIYLYQDTPNRGIFKNWYYMSGGSPGNYTFDTLDNPMTLSSVGTIQDPNGNDTIPFYYPYNETPLTPGTIEYQPYYIEVWSANSDGTPAVLQFTRQGFPYQQSVTPSSLAINTENNLIINNEFWRNIITSSITEAYPNTGQGYVFCPSQFESIRWPDMQFFKNYAGATDVIQFNRFSTDNALTNDSTPEFYLQVQCTSALSGGETYKYIQIPITTHIKTVGGQLATLTLQVQNLSGNPLTLPIYILQDPGTGATASQVPLLIQNIQPGSTWLKIPLPFTFPPAAGIAQTSLGPGGDDAYYLQIYFPVNSLFNVNIAKPAVFLCSPIQVPTNDVRTYNQSEAIFNSARTGDVRVSLNSFTPFGWVPANDGSIGNPSSSATTRANSDTWPLYNLIWNSVLDNWAPVSSGRGSSAIADFSSNKTLTLTRTLGRVLTGVNPTSFPSVSFTTSYTSSHVNLTCTNTNFPTGTPIQLTGGSLPSALSANTVYYANVSGSSTIQLFRVLDFAYVQPTQTFTTNHSVSNDNFLVSSTVNYFVGQEVVLSGGSLPPPFSAGTVYFATNFVVNTSVQLATTRANALAGTSQAFSSDGTGSITISAIDIGSDGSGTVQTALGAWIGTDQYILQPSDLPPHIHSNPAAGQFLIAASGSAGYGGSSGVGESTITGPIVGSPTQTGTLNNPLSLIQPSTLMNIFFKL